MRSPSGTVFAPSVQASSRRFDVPPMVSVRGAAPVYALRSKLRHLNRDDTVRPYQSTARIVLYPDGAVNHRIDGPVRRLKFCSRLSSRGLYAAKLLFIEAGVLFGSFFQIHCCDFPD